MHRRVGAEFAAQYLVGAIREDLVAVHIVRSSRTGLVYVHDELIPMLSCEHFIGGLHYGIGEAGLEPSGLLVGQGRRALDPDYRVHECGQGTEAGDGEVLGGAQGLDPVKRFGRNFLRAKRVAFGAGCWRHDCCSSSGVIVSDGLGEMYRIRRPAAHA